MLDTLSIVDELVAAGIDERQARAHAQAIASAIAQHQGNLVTKDFLRAELGAKIDPKVGALRTEFGALREEFSALREEVSALRKEVGVFRADVNANISRLETRLIRWVVGVGIGLAALIVAAASVFLTHLA